MRLRTVSFLFVIGLFLASSMIFQQERSISALAGSSSHAPPPMEWSKTYGGSGTQIAYAVEQAPDGGYVLFGNNYSAQSRKSRIIRTDASGNVLWDKTDQSLDPWHYGKAMHRSGDSGYVIVGGGAYEGNVLFKLDENANELWSRAYQITGYKIFFTCVSDTNDGGFVLGGFVSSPSDQQDFCMAKVDQNGTLEWIKTYDTQKDEATLGVEQAIDGGYILAGGAGSQIGGLDGWIVKTDETGNMMWNRTYGSADISMRDSLQSIERTSDNGYVLAGYCGPSPNSQGWLVKIDINGIIQWERQYGDDPSLRADVYSVRQIDDGFIVLGGYGNEIWLVRTDLNGYILWKTTYAVGSDRSALSVIQTNDGGYAIAGDAVTGNDGDMLLMKIMRGNPPIAAFSYSPTNASIQQKITFDGSSSFDLDEDIVSYQWDFDDGNVSSTTDAVVSHAFVYSRIYNVTLTITDSKELCSSLSRTVWISALTRISLALSSSTSAIGFKIEIDGNLTSDAGAISNAPVLLSYSVTGGQTWNDITLTITELDGHYSAVWMPSATGNYLIKASWAGNSTYPKASIIVNLAVIPFEERNVFSVISNSTVSALNFESVQRELTFTVEGPSGTMGYADVYIAKTLIGNIEGVEVKLNGTEIEYTATSLDDSWLIHFTYQHSAHTVSVGLGTSPSQGGTTGIDTLTTALVIAALVAILIVVVILIRKRRTHTKTSG